MQNPPLVLHKWGENILIFPFRVCKSRIVYATESAFRGIRLRGWPVVRWPSVCSSMAIGVAPKWLFVSGPMAIHLESDGHRTGVDTPFSVSHFRQTLVWGAFLACRFPAFQELRFLLPRGIQRLTWLGGIKNRVFPSIASLARKYAILAYGIYSLTKCQ